MNEHEELLHYYRSELTYLRKMGSAFAERYPRVAGRLEFGGGMSPDPHVERLLESFAFLTGRIQHQIEREFPELTTALLDILYPSYVSPVPSMAIARFDVDPEQGQLTTGHKIDRSTPLFAETDDGLTCRFQTCYPVTLWPLEVVDAGFESTAQFEFLDTVSEVATVLRIRLECQGAAVQDLDLNRIRFYLHGDRILVNTLYELLFAYVTDVAVLSEENQRPLFISKDAIRPVGFSADEAVLPQAPQAYPGYRIVQEYFTFPEQFLFIDIDLPESALKGSNTTLDLLIMLNQRPQEQLVVDRGTFCLGCTPVINLFRKTTEPIRVDQRKTEYRLNPDKRRERTTEIHSILSVTSSANAEEEVTHYVPFYSYRHNWDSEEPHAFWYARRTPTGRDDVPGTDMHLTFLDLNAQPTEPPLQTVYAHTLCTNRNLAVHLPAGARLQIEESAPLLGISCLTKPTTAIPPSLGGASQWKIISQLSLNHLSLSDGPESLQALREILRLSSMSERHSAQQQISGIREMTTRPIVRLIGQDAWKGMCKGIEISLMLDEEFYVGSSAFLFSAVLQRFFAMYASVNSFTQLVVHSSKREGIWKRWPPMAGEQTVL